MIYDYKCSCGEEFEVIKPILEYSEVEPCPSCKALSKRHYKAPTTNFVKGFEPDYYHSLGKVFTSKRELQYHLDKNNLMPIGNDFGSGQKMQEYFDKQRKENLEKRYQEI